jgi:eukaryotic-like serine/threonine-protein kinase
LYGCVAQFSPGLRLAERYVLETPIGSGGMSTVWRALDEVLGRQVAVKTLDGPLAADAELREAIRREARAAARITHPHVAQVYDFREAPQRGGTPYLVMELLHGQNLADRLRTGPVPWSEAVRVCASVAEALAAAHRLDVVHRDIKPDNVMLTPTGAKVVDFGIAAVAAGPSTDGGSPRGGTPAYVAPEILTGAAGTPESDVYSLGAVLYEALTGSPPVEARTLVEAAAVHERGEPPEPISVPSLPAEVRDLCIRCLSPSPASRPTSDEAAEVLSRWAVPAARATGTAAVAAASAVAAVANPTLLDASPVPPARQPQLAASVASAGRGASGSAVAGVLERGRRPLAAVAVAAALLGILFIVTAAALTNGGSLAGSARATPTSQAPVTTQPPRPTNPTTPSAALADLEALIAGAVVGGKVENATAHDLVDEVKELRERVNDGRNKDVVRRAEGLRNRLDREVREGNLDAGVATAIDGLLDILISLQTGTDGNSDQGNSG